MEKFAIETESVAIGMEKLAIGMGNVAVETIAASYRTAGLHFDRAREPYRTERGS